MAKKYAFYRQDIINLLLNHKSYISKKAIELTKQGRDIRYVTFKEIRFWTEEFFDQAIKQGEVTFDTLLDQLDEVLAKTHGMTSREMAEKIKQEEN